MLLRILFFMALYAAVAAYYVYQDKPVMATAFAIFTLVWPFMPLLAKNYRRYRTKHAVSKVG